MYQSLQGNYGLGEAIAYFTTHKTPVCIPLNDTQKYDLVVDIDGELKRVQVKTTKYEVRPGVFQVMLKNAGGSSKGSTLRYFDKESCDLLFILCGNGDMYLIPIDAVDSSTTLNLGKKYELFKVEKVPFSDFKS